MTPTPLRLVVAINPGASAGGRKHLADGVLAGRCPNCTGELVRRPVRPAEKLLKHPASTVRKVKPTGCAAA